MKTFGTCDFLLETQRKSTLRWYCSTQSQCTRLLN